jgi:predicted O-methyltransferase YrrM
MDIIPTLINNINDDFINALETGTIRSYDEKHESTRWLGESIINGKIVSIDIDSKSIQVSKDICKHLNNIEWIQGDSLEILNNLEESKYNFILLDSVNDKEHIFKEFKLALKLIKLGGIIMIDDFGVDMYGNIPDPSQPEAQKGVKVFNMLKQHNLLEYMKVYQSIKGVQVIFLNISEKLKNFNFD